jgi:hypothetical protein
MLLPKYYFKIGHTVYFPLLSGPLCVIIHLTRDNTLCIRDSVVKHFLDEPK